jgi:hypothetical protein
VRAALFFLYNRSHRRRSAWAVEWLYFLEFWKTNLAPALSVGAFTVSKFVQRGSVPAVVDRRHE